MRNEFKIIEMKDINNKPEYMIVGENAYFLLAGRTTFKTKANAEKKLAKLLEKIKVVAE